MTLPSVDLRAQDLLEFHDSRHALERWATTGVPEGRNALWQAVKDNHRFNCLLWDEEDLARRRSVPDSEIAKNKRAIDGFNQKRNDAIERIDEQLLANYFAGTRPLPGSRMSSETPGGMIDRLSILSLKIHHMRLQTLRTDVGRDHTDTCAEKLARLQEQRHDLSGCLDRLLAEAGRGETYFKIYRQYKMYNDPALNPAIYQESKRSMRS